MSEVGRAVYSIFELNTGLPYSNHGTSSVFIIGESTFPGSGFRYFDFGADDSAAGKRAHPTAYCSPETQHGAIQLVMGGRVRTSRCIALRRATPNLGLAMQPSGLRRHDPFPAKALRSVDGRMRGAEICR